jgi:hypothetical protein
LSFSVLSGRVACRSVFVVSERTLSNRRAIAKAPGNADFPERAA